MPPPPGGAGVLRYLSLLVPKPRYLLEKISKFSPRFAQTKISKFSPRFARTKILKVSPRQPLQIDETFRFKFHFGVHALVSFFIKEQHLFRFKVVKAYTANLYAGGFVPLLTFG